jgi:hypothetical protein
MRVCGAGVTVRGAAVAAACVLVGAALTATAATAPTAQGNRAAAGKDARALLALVAMPRGAVRSAGVPTGAAAIANPYPRVMTPDLVDVYGWWRVPGAPAAVLAYIAAHTRHRTRGFSGGGRSGGRTWSTVELDFARVPGVLDARNLVVKVLALSRGLTAVRVDAQVVWLVPRPAAERIPAGIAEVDITRGRPGHAPAVSVTVTNQAKLRRIISLIDGLPTVQPYVMSCPEFGEESPIATFAFRAERGRAIVAQASQIANATQPTTGCDPMNLSIRGRPETPLRGGVGVLRQVGQLLGIQLALSR